MPIAKKTNNVATKAKPAIVGEIVESKELAVIQKEIGVTIREAGELKITGEKDMRKANDILSVLNKFNDRLVKDKKSLTTPLNEVLKNIRGRYAPVEEVLEANIEAVREKMGDYQTEMLRIQKAEADRIAARVGEGKGKLKVETAMNKIDELDAPEAKIEGAEGSVSFRTDKILKIIDMKLIKEYVMKTGDWSFMDLNEGALLDALKAGKVVFGAVIQEIQVPINRRR